MKKNKLRLLACQIKIPQTRTAKERDQHIKKIASELDTALQQTPCDLVVLPELSTVEYSRESFAELPELAESLDGRSVEQFQTLANQHHCHVVFGMPRKTIRGYYISQVVLGPEGLIGYYDKIHICQYGASMEKEYFQRGQKLLTFGIGPWVFAPIICYDIRIPELTRTLVIDHNVNCLLHSGAYFRDESFATWRAFATTRAMENQIYLLSLNRSGKDYGESVFYPPWVDDRHPSINLHLCDEEYRVIDLDLEVLNKVRTDYTFLKDRLENYSNLPT
ncbi:MAG: putative amidohydrolase [Parasphingorhabdus sp.]|jgi:predicted amidohydrolase